MSKIILLNGSINSGKTTIATRIKNMCENVAHIEVDALCEFISWMPIEIAIPINLENAISVSKNFVRKGLHVIISYPLSITEYQYIVAKLDELNAEIIPITLFCTPEKIKVNRGTRDLSHWEINRIDWMFKNGLANPGYGTIIDTTNQSIESTIGEFLNLTKLKTRNPIV